MFYQVLSITKSRKDDGASASPQAHVAWYGSSTSSLMSCDQLNPFLETFQVRLSVCGDEMRAEGGILLRLFDRVFSLFPFYGVKIGVNSIPSVTICKYCGLTKGRLILP